MRATLDFLCALLILVGLCSWLSAKVLLFFPCTPRLHEADTVEGLRRQLELLKEAFAQYRELAEPVLLGATGQELHQGYVRRVLLALCCPLF